MVINSETHTLWSSLLTTLFTCLTHVMPKANSSKTSKPTWDGETTRDKDVSTSHADSSMISPAPLIPIHCKALRQAQSTVTHPYISTTGILKLSLQHLLARGTCKSQHPYELSNQELQPQASDLPQDPQPLPKWSHLQVQGLHISISRPLNSDPSVSSDSAICSNLIHLILICYQASHRIPSSQSTRPEAIEG